MGHGLHLRGGKETHVKKAKEKKGHRKRADTTTQTADNWSRRRDAEKSTGNRLRQSQVSHNGGVEKERIE